MNDSKDILGRARMIFFVIAFFGILILGRAFSIGVINRDYWQEKKENQTIKFQTIEAARGNLYSTDGSLLATSLPIYDLRMDLKAEYLDKVFKKEVDSLAFYLSKTFKDKSAAEYSSILKRERQNKNRYFLIRKGVKHNVLKLVKTFPIFRYGKYRGGLIVETRSRREMPFRHLALRTLGRYQEGVKDVGIEGAYNDFLQGVEGKQLVQKISSGVWKPLNADNEIEPKEGNDIITSIDIVIQDVAEAELERQLRKHHAQNGCVVLMEVETGYIRAIANLEMAKDSSYNETYNFAIGNGTEPGSTFKLASLMALFEDGLAKPEDIYNTNGGKVRFGNRIMKDSHEGGFGKISLAEAFKVSSNTAISQAVNSAYQKHPEKFIERIKKFRLDQSLGIDIPGERAPLIKSPENKSWSGTTLPWMSIGYESRLTPLQILAFYNAVANNGKFMKPQFVEAISHRGQTIQKFDPIVLDEAICSQATIDKLKPMLESVVENGTASNLKNPFFKIAGKTGTAQIAYDNGGYVKDGVKKYQASFVGYFPAQNPKYSCIVVVSAPNSAVYYGNLVAGPVFKGVADKVYARNLELQDKEQVFAFNQSDVEQKRVANAGDLAVIMKKSGKKLALPADENWVQIMQGAQTLSTSARTNDKDNVPDVRGMGLKDALYLLENKGLRVKVNGRGQVRSQSIKAGTRINPNMIILIELT
ncbi:MAG: penicillin-binding transpeptidase domain-containing protein [Bacteroidia bacterium]